ncbi:MAG: KH domain-containing protein [Anaerotruncus sp.]|nr:KH domain-containing protein [Anaerotruncus sp.]
MKYEYIGHGKTREDAAADAVRGLTAALAKDGLGTPVSADIHEEVIALPKKKILGLFGGSDAEVKVTYEIIVKKDRKPQQKKAKPQPKKEYKAEKAEAAEPAEPIEVPGEVVSQAEAYLKTIIDGFKVEDAKITGEVKDGVLELTVDCDDYGIIIGRRGDTLDSLQYLTSLYVKKLCGRYIRVVINVGDYREKRVETLRHLARKEADYVARSGRRYTFEPMNPYERRIIHTTVQEIEGVESISVGYGQDRKVMLQPEGGVRYRSDRGGRRSYSDNGRPAAKKAAPLPKDFTKFGKIEVNSNNGEE